MTVAREKQNILLKTDRQAYIDQKRVEFLVF